MLVYRAVSQNEYSNPSLFKKDNSFNMQNTYDYQEGVNYKHFYYHIDAAYMLSDNNLEDGKSIYPYFMVYDIPTNVLKKYICFGIYMLKDDFIVDSLLNCLKSPYYPYPLALVEFALPVYEFKEEYLVGKGKRDEIKPVDERYSTFIPDIVANKASFVDYIKDMYEYAESLKDGKSLADIGLFDIRETIAMLENDTDKYFNRLNK